MLTVEGKILHKRVDNPLFSEVREGVLITRAMPVASYRLGLYGICDVVEFHPSPDGITIPGRKGTFQPVSVEYKRGKEKKNPVDEVQLCAQTICLEEMLSVAIPHGYLYYGEIRHRIEIAITDELRNLVIKMADEMHNYFERGYTPRVKPSKACQSCSLEDICLPSLQGNAVSALAYIQAQIDSKS